TPDDDRQVVRKKLLGRARRCDPQGGQAPRRRLSLRARGAPLSAECESAPDRRYEHSRFSPVARAFRPSLQTLAVDEKRPRALLTRFDPGRLPAPWERPVAW